MKKFFHLFFMCFCCYNCNAQDSSLLKDIEETLTVSEKVTGAFKSTRVINAHSVEMLAKHNLDFRILHRFGFVSDGVKQLFGLDAASMRMSFDYGITNNLTVGIGRSTFRKELDAFVKTRILQQTKGARQIPFSIIVAAGYTVHTEEYFDGQKPTVADRSAYYLQLVAGRKFNSKFSMQLSPIFVHTNIPFVVTDDRQIFAMGGGARYKISKRTALTIDYHHPFGKIADNYTSPLSMGVDIETGGHVFQLHFSNATGMNERAYITQTTGNFLKGDMRLGFNLSRMFKVGKKHEHK
jgi:hypothetical protein